MGSLIFQIWFSRTQMKACAKFAPDWNCYARAAKNPPVPFWKISGLQSCLESPSPFLKNIRVTILSRIPQSLKGYNAPYSIVLYSMYWKKSLPSQLKFSLCEKCKVGLVQKNTSRADRPIGPANMQQIWKIWPSCLPPPGIQAHTLGQILSIESRTRSYLKQNLCWLLPTVSISL